MAKFNLPFANAGVHRYPTPEEQAAGLPCGPADRKLFNGLFNRLETELGNTIAHSGQVASDDDMSQLTRAIRRGSWSYGVAGGTADALTVTLDPPLETYAAGLVLYLLISRPNMGPATINVDELGAVPIKLSAANLVPGDLMAGAVVCLVYDGSVFQLIGRSQGRLIGVQIFGSLDCAPWGGQVGNKFLTGWGFCYGEAHAEKTPPPQHCDETRDRRSLFPR